MKEIVLLSCLFFLSAGNAICQTNEDTIYLNDFPVRKGIIIQNKLLPEPGRIVDPGPGITFLSIGDSIFHFANGKVLRVFTIEGDKVVMIKNNDGYFVSYAGLKQSNLQTGDSISERTFIGILSKNDDGKFELQLIITDSKARDYYFDETIKILKKYASIKLSTN